MPSPLETLTINESSISPIKEGISQNTPLPPIEDVVVSESSINPLKPGVQDGKSLPPIDEETISESSITPLKPSGQDTPLRPVDEEVIGESSISPLKPNAAQDAPLERFTVPNFDGGVVTRYSPILIPDNSVQWAQNVYFDEHGVSRRYGYDQFNTTYTVFTDSKSVRGLWPFTADDGTRYLVALSSQTIYKVLTTGSFSPIDGLSGLSAVSDMDAVAYLGKIWFSNGSDSVFYWDGSSTKTVTEAPLGGMIEGFRNRIAIAGKASELSYLFMSKELDGEEWTTGPTTSVDPVAIAIGGINAKPIKCLYSGYRDFLFVATEDETYGVYGFGRNDFAVRTISREVGCIEDRSLQEKDGSLYFLSRRGLEKMTGQSITRISDGVKDIFDTIIDNTAVSRTKLYTTQAHWEAGNLSPSGPGAKMSATISPGSVTPSTWSHTDTDASDWTLGTLTNISTSQTTGSIEILFSTQTYIYDNFTDTNYTANPVWTVTVGSWSASNTTLDNLPPNPPGLQPYVSNSENGTWIIYSQLISTYTAGISSFTMSCSRSDNGGETIENIFYFYSSSASTQTTNGYALGCKSINGLDTEIPVNLYRVDGGTLTSIGNTIFDSNVANPNGNLSVLINRSLIGVFTISITPGDGTCGSLGPITDNTYNNSKYLIFEMILTNNITAANYRIYLDDIYISTGGYTSGIYTSPIFDTALSTTVGGPFTFSDTIITGSTIAYSVRESSYNDVAGMGSWNLVSTTTSGAYRIPLTKEFWQYKAALSTDYSTQTPSVQLVALQATTTGEYIHQCAEIGTISTWGNFQANSTLTGSGAITYYVSTGTTCDSVQRTTATWNAQTNNSAITVSTAAYMGVKEFFSVATPTDTVKLNDVTLNWVEGIVRPPVASGVYLNRYYMAYTTAATVGSVNDFVFVADKNDAVTFLQHMNCYSMAIFNRDFFCGDANNTGKIFQLETGEDDNGTAFTSKIRTKAYSFGDSDAEKEFVKMYAAFAPESSVSLNIDITPSYHLDLSTTAITLSTINTGEDSTAGALVSKIPFSMSNNVSGRFLDLEFSNTGLDSHWTLFGLSVYFRRFEIK